MGSRKKICRSAAKHQLLTRLIEIDTKDLRQRKTLGETLLVARQQLSGLRASAFDVAIDFQGLLKSAVIAKLSGAKRRFGFSKKNLREPSSRFLLTETFETPPRLNIIQKNLHLLQRSLKIPVPQSSFEFPIFTQREHQREADEIASRIRGDFALLNPAGGWVTKLWPAERFGILADRLWEEAGLSSVIAAAPGEKPLAERAIAASSSGKLAFAAPSLMGFFELARRAAIYVGGDTGPTHLAIAAKTPVVGIFGPTEWWRNGSLDPNDICVERNDISCRSGCHRRTCSNWICMEIDVEKVLQAVKKRLELSIGR